MYSDEERAIFRFEVNGEKRALDPVSTLRALMTYEDFDLESKYAIVSTIDFEGEGSIDRMQMEALSELIDASRVAFDLAPFKNGEGVLDSEVVEILSSFLVYLGAVKKKLETSPMSSDSTAEMSLAAN